MIKINLVVRDRKGSLLPEGATSTLSGYTSLSGMSQLGREQLQQLKELPLKRLGYAVALFIIGSFGVDQWVDQSLKGIQQEMEAEQAKQATLKKEFDKTKSYNTLKTQLEADEKSIRAKLSTIQELLNDRTTPPKILLALSAAIPQEAWLEELKVDNQQITLKGASLGYNQVSDFMKALGENAFVKDVTLKSTQQTKDTNGVEVNTFDLSMKRALVGGR